MNRFGFLGTGCPVKVMCKGEVTCAFANIANLCYLLTDKIAGEFFKNKRYTPGRELVEEHIFEHEDWDEWMNSKFFIGCQLLRQKFRYDIKYLKDDFDVMRDADGHYVVESPKFEGILAGYEVMPPVMVKQRIDTIGLWHEPKEKAYFQEIVKSDSSDSDE
eukprot:14366726-Ditylum_brightwellii.AAC.1